MTLFKRDNIVWTMTFVGALLTFTLSHTHLIPMGLRGWAEDLSALIGFLAGYFTWSPLPSSPTHPDGPLVTRLVRAAQDMSQPDPPARQSKGGY